MEFYSCFEMILCLVYNLSHSYILRRIIINIGLNSYSNIWNICIIMTLICNITTLI